LLIDPRWELTRRVADSAGFRNSPKLRAFLLHVCESTLLERRENVREQYIGCAVFGRSPDYNLSEDNIVRVEARELRKRLALYFSGEGQDEAYLIEIPKGGYVAVFKPRQDPAPAAANAEPAPPLAEPRRRQWVIAAPVVVILMLAAFYLIAVRRSPNAPPGETARGRDMFSQADVAMYADMLGPLGAAPERETLLVLSNPVVVLYYGHDDDRPVVEGQGLTIPAPPQLKSSFGEALNNIDRNKQKLYLHLTREEYTGMGEAIASYQIGRLMQALGRSVRLTQGRFLDWDHMPKQDLILLGAPQINDWTYQNFGKSNFNMQFRMIENSSPLPGERKSYSAEYDSGPHGAPAITDYGVVKMMPSQYGPRMLLLAGNTSAGTAGAGDFVASAEKMRALHAAIRDAAPGKPFPAEWEALIKIQVRDGIAVSNSLVACRPTRATR
jgi:hypothetical protein